MSDKEERAFDQWHSVKLCCYEWLWRARAYGQDHDAVKFMEWRIVDNAIRAVFGDDVYRHLDMQVVKIRPVEEADKVTFESLGQPPKLTGGECWSKKMSDKDSDDETSGRRAAIACRMEHRNIAPGYGLDFEQLDRLCGELQTVPSRRWGDWVFILKGDEMKLSEIGRPARFVDGGIAGPSTHSFYEVERSPDARVGDCILYTLEERRELVRRVFEAAREGCAPSDVFEPDYWGADCLIKEQGL